MSYVANLSDDMFNKIIKYETGKSFGYTMKLKDLNGYDLGDAKGHKTYGYGLLYNPTNKQYMDSVKSYYSQLELEGLYLKTVDNMVSKVVSWKNNNNLTLTLNQIDSIVCACYNFGMGFLKKNVCELIKLNPNNTLIHTVWEHLSDSQGQKYPGLLKRRKFEADWYFENSAVSTSEGTAITYDNNSYSIDSSTVSSGISIGSENNIQTSNSVWGNSGDNTYLSINSVAQAQDSSIIDRRRIYEYKASTIQLDEMSLRLNENINDNNIISKAQDVSNNTNSLDNNLNENPYLNKGDLTESKTMSVGTTYPLLRINDHYYTQNEITLFELSTSGFIPTISCNLSLNYNDILKSNTIKDGDVCSVFMSPGHGLFKSYRGDFKITNTYMLKQSLYKAGNKISFYFTGELFVPSLYNGGLTFSFAGTSRDALIDAADKTGLGFYFCDPENTEDVLMWYSTTDGNQKEGGDPPVIDYIKTCASHAWKNFYSFYDCWIDPRYAITFLNVNYMLGEDGLDEEIDLTAFNNALSLTRGIDGLNFEKSDSQKKKNPLPLLKLLTNIAEDKNSMTSFFVKSFKEFNDGTISNIYGMKSKCNYNIKNSGLSADENSITMELSIPVNETKLRNGFYVMGGPGKNLTYELADNGSYVEQHKVVIGGQIADTQSDVDAQDIINNKNNNTASGNTNKFYEVGYDHNEFNNAFLKKKTIDVELNGLNMQLMRGEKIPMILIDNTNDLLNLTHSQNGDATYNKIYVNGCGWFLITRIKWVYERDKSETGTQWTTKLTLTRREWPVPGYNKNQNLKLNTNTITVENNINTGTTNEAVENNTTTTDTNNTADDNLTTSGLTQTTLDLYNTIKQVCESSGKKIKLISGRRWAADADGNRIEGEPIIKDGDVYKFVNSKNDIIWFSSKTSRHIYGEAFDIINDTGTTFDEIAEIIISSNEILSLMFINGYYLCTEITKDDYNNTVKHYHIGKTDTSDNISIEGYKKWWQGLLITRNSTIITYNNKTYDLNLYINYQNA